MFTLNTQEVIHLRSQTVTSSWGGRRHPPIAFNEYGVAMLSAVLHSKRAIQVSIAIIRAFVRMKELISTNKDIAARVEKLERGQERTASVIEILVEDIDRLGRKVEHLDAPSPYGKRRIGYIIDDD